MNFQQNASLLQVLSQSNRFFQRFAPQRFRASLFNWSVFIAVFAALAFTAPASRADEAFDRILAQVGDEVILLSEVEDLRVGMANQPGFSALSPEKQREQILQRLIDEKVLLVKARRDTSIKVQEREVQQHTEDRWKNLVQQQGGEDALRRVLDQSMGMTLGQFRTHLTGQIREQMLKQRLQHKYVGDLEPSSKQVRDFYQKYADSLPVLRDNISLAHVQVKVKPDPIKEKAARDSVAALIARLDAGEPFADLAKKYSDDPAGKDGGDLGFTKKGTLDPEFEKAAFRLANGEHTSEPVRSAIGWHAIKVTGKKDNEVRTSHILVRIQATASDSARAKAMLDSLKTEIAKGADFATQAQRYSDDKRTRAAGGRLGWFTRPQLNERYKEIADQLTPGEVSEPILIGDSFHLFKLLAKSDERKMTLEDDWAEISQIAKNWLMGERLSTFVEEWKKEVYVEIRPADNRGSRSGS